MVESWQQEDPPINISVDKLLDWLISRRHCVKTWQNKDLVVREKINNAIQDMPPHEDIVKLLSGTHINYFHCLKIIDILKETEADTKNMFGRYGSQRMKDWQEIVRLYKEDNLYLAEAAHMLIKNVQYEIPSIKNQIRRLESSAALIEKNIADRKKAEAAAREEFYRSCKELDITGKKIKQELRAKVSDLPEIHNQIAEKAKKLEKIVNIYTAFVEFVLGKEFDGGCVPMVKYVVEKGNTTTYEWTYGEPPLSVVEPDLNVNCEDDDDDDDDNNDEAASDKPVQEVNLEIDFGGLDLNADVQLDNLANLDVGDDIDWGDDNDADGAAEQVDYNISLEESGIVVESGGQEGGIATGELAYTVLDNPTTRNDFINQLYELEAFLVMRREDSKGKMPIFLIEAFQTSPVIQDFIEKSVDNMLSDVRSVLADFSDYKFKQLHKIKHSARYVDVVASSLKHKLAVAKKMVPQQEKFKEKLEETRAKVPPLLSILELVKQRTAELHQEIERDISKRYNNRPVHLRDDSVSEYARGLRNFERA